MCGIAGWFDTGAIAEHERVRLQRMVDSIAHRGPDGQGTLVDGHAALGHARLAIIDVAGGAQPQSTHDGGVSITFNGEIYNYKALREGLAKNGYPFVTSSDTEVVLALYQTEGVAGFERLRGMFAFALWDRRTREGWLVRDAIGIKPLFVCECEDGALVFASEAKAILASGRHQALLDESALHLLMSFRYLPGERSMFRGIRQLAPGAALRWRTDGTTSERVLVPRTSALTEPLAALRDSVDAHFTADVEVGAYLSGGYDSAAVVALAKGLGHDGLRTFTLDVGDDPAEAGNAARTAELFGLENIRGEDLGDVATRLPALVWHLEVPKINAFQVAELARHTAGHVKVALSGLGGDELFLGYNMHRILALASNARRATPSWISESIGAAAAAAIQNLSSVPWTETQRALLMLQSLGDWPRVYGLLRNVWDRPPLRAAMYGPRLLEADLPDAFAVLEDLWPDGRDPVVAAAEFEWRHKMVNDLLWQEDRCSMARGLEVRVPFVDTELAACVRPMSRKRLMPGGQRKGFMREMLGSILPAEILTRPKSGFQVDAPAFFHRHLAVLADDLLSEDRVHDYGLFNPDFVRRIRRLQGGTRLRWHYFVLYLMLGAHLWVDLFERGGGVLVPGVVPESTRAVRAPAAAVG